MKSTFRSLIAGAMLVASMPGYAHSEGVKRDYGPRDETERGLWQQMDEYEPVSNV